jgi:hypothetical protein
MHYDEIVVWIVVRCWKMLMFCVGIDEMWSCVGHVCSLQSLFQSLLFCVRSDKMADDKC